MRIKSLNNDRLPIKQDLITMTMTITTEQVYFTKLFPQVSQFGMGDSSDIDFEFCLRKENGTLVSNKYGEFIIRQQVGAGRYDPLFYDEDENIYYVVTINNHECSDCMCAFKGYDHSYSSYDLQDVLDKYFNNENDVEEYYESINYTDHTPEDDEIYRIHPLSDLELEYYENYNEYNSEESSLSFEPVESCEYEEEFIEDEDGCCNQYRFSSNKKILNFIDSENSNYSAKYQLVLDLSGSPIQTHNGEYISRIKKNNGKHRYYLTQVESEMISDDLTYKPSSLFYCFKSEFVGFDLSNVMQQHVYAPCKWL